MGNKRAELVQQYMQALQRVVDLRDEGAGPAQIAAAKRSAARLYAQLDPEHGAPVAGWH